MKSIMKTILRNTKLVMILAFLPALLSAAQAQAVTYQTKYKNAYQGAYVQTPGNASATTASPSVGFQSTSAFSDQFGNGEQSMLNSDGTVNDEAYGVGSRHPGSIRRADNNGDGYDDVTGLPVNPIVDPNDPGNVPLGDALLPLMLIACAYAGVRSFRRKRA